MLNDTLTINSNTFVRTGPGRWVNTASDVKYPTVLLISKREDKNGVISIQFKYETWYTAVVNSVTSYHLMTFHSVLRAPQAIITDSRFDDARIYLDGLKTISTIVSRLMRGES
jgi:hypothetical protein